MLQRIQSSEYCQWSEVGDVGWGGQGYPSLVAATAVRFLKLNGKLESVRSTLATRLCRFRFAFYFRQRHRF
jgi:hypothetical protein